MTIVYKKDIPKLLGLLEAWRCGKPLQWRNRAVLFCQWTDLPRSQNALDLAGYEFRIKPGPTK